MNQKRINAKPVSRGESLPYWQPRHSNNPHITNGYVLPATADAYEQMVEQMLLGTATPELVRMQLRAIGITVPKKDRT